MKQRVRSSETSPVCVASNDDAFAARMRFHQSWYREHVLQRPAGVNPSAKSKDVLYGNMLTENDGKEGWNFLSEEIRQVAEARLKEGKDRIEVGRLRNNMLSSQPMCFNLFGPLAADGAWGLKLVQALPGVPKNLTDAAITFEYAPDPAKHLNDGTSFDAFISYRRSNGAKGFIGVETKLTEPFSQAEYQFERYRPWSLKTGWWWADKSEAKFSDPVFNQLWRNQLLAFSMLQQGKPAFSEGFCAVVHHPQDTVCTKAIKAYRQHLKPEGEALLLDWTLEAIVETWKPLASTRAQKEWLAAFQLRYLDLGASEFAWEQR